MVLFGVIDMPQNYATTAGLAVAQVLLILQKSLTMFVKHSRDIFNTIHIVYEVTRSVSNISPVL